MPEKCSSAMGGRLRSLEQRRYHALGRQRGPTAAVRGRATLPRRFRLLQVSSRQSRNLTDSIQLDSPDFSGLPTPGLGLARFRALFEPAAKSHEDEYLGSAWRGAFGHALKAAACVTGLPVCKGCELFHSCTYSYVFETPPPRDASKLRRYPSAPHPFVLEVPATGMHRLADGTMALPFSLFGRGVEKLPLFVVALKEAGERGVGTARTGYRFIAIEQDDNAGRWTRLAAAGEAFTPPRAVVPHIANLPGLVQVQLCTPLSLRRNGNALAADELRFADLFSSLLRRLSLLCHFHGDESLETDFQALTAWSKDVRLLESRLTDRRFRRFSSRQVRSMPFGGIVGTMTLAGETLRPFWPYLWLGQWSHAGRAATMGLGRYRVLDAASLRSMHGAPAAGNMTS